MPIPAPQIDKRTLDEIVATTETLAHDFTFRAIQPTPDRLLGQVLDEDVIDPNTGQAVATAGMVVNAAIAARIASLPGLEQIKVQGWQRAGAVVTVAPTPDTLLGRTLAEDIIDPTADPAGPPQIIAAKGVLVDDILAARISQVAGLARVKVTLGQDMGWTLIRLFSRMAGLVIERINQTPEKNFLAFLDLIGTQMLPPQPARAPLTFRLAAGSPVDAFVPAGTQVAVAGAPDEINFETDRDLVVTTAQLTAIFVREPDGDQVGDYTIPATGGADATFPVFAGNQAIEHSLYLARDDFFQLTQTKSATLIIDSPDAARLAVLPIVWAYWDGKIWQPLSVNATLPANNRWQVTIANLPAPAPQTLFGLSAGWLRAKLDIPLPHGELTVIDADQARLQIKRQGLLPLVAQPAVPLSTPPTINLLDASEPFYPFGQMTALTDFYVNVEEAFVRGAATVSLKLLLAGSGGASGNLVLLWQFWDGAHWQELGQSGPDHTSLGNAAFAFADATQALTQDGVVAFNAPLNWQALTMAGRTGRWLHVQIIQGNYGMRENRQPPQIGALTADYTWELPRINGITASVRVEANGLAPDLGFINGVAADFSKGIYPFGERPRFNDTLYLASADVFARPGAQVTLKVALSNSNPTQAKPKPTDPPPSPPAPVVASSDLQIVWEVWTGKLWQELGQVTPTNPSSGEQKFSFKDTTQAFTRDGSVTFTLPTVAPTTISGETNTWVRARIAQGNYGIDAYYKQRTDATGKLLTDQQGNPMYDLVPATFAPPVIKTLTVGYIYQPSGPLASCQLFNDFVADDKTDEAAQTDGVLFIPFTPTTDTRPALYLGFDRPFANRPTTLYAQVEAPLYNEANSPTTTEPAQVAWEYAGPTGWNRLGAQDETTAFAGRGLLSFIGPADFTQRTEFGLPRYWLRACWTQGLFNVPPRLRRVLTNTTWASQATTLYNELLGSSDGSRNQIFQTLQAPVLEGQRIEVQERELPSPAEQAAILALEGEDAITPILDSAGRLQAVWIRWHATPDFHGSGPRDRHYSFDALAGTVRFGDGQHGMTPPLGRDNLRVAFYRSGGGGRGNQPTGVISQLKSTVPYVDGVSNGEAATGGADAETLDELKERGPRALRHRDRAVTAQDFEDLAHAASPDVALAHALGTQGGDDAGRVGLVLVPRSLDAQPIPSLELINRVGNYIKARCTAAVDLWLAGPDWVRVIVTAEVAPVALDGADVVAATVVGALQRFLHPLTGGVDQRGWAFGRKPHKSDLYALIEAIDGVDHVRFLAVTEEKIGTVRPDRFLVFSGAHRISMVR